MMYGLLISRKSFLLNRLHKLTHNKFEMSKRVNPRGRNNFFSVVLFGYSLTLFRKGLRKDLEEEDLYGIPGNCGSKICGDQSEKQFETSKSIYELLWSQFGVQYSLICFATILWTETNSICQPYGQSRLISYFEENQSSISKTDAYYCGAIVTVLKIASIFFWRHIAIYEYYLAIKIRASLKSLLYRKALKLSPAAFAETNLGNIVTILTKDINTIEENLWILMELIIVVLQTCTISYLLWYKMGEAAFIGIGLLFLVLPIQVYLSSLLTNIKLRVGKYTDSRLLVTQETLSSIKILKMYCWESAFGTKISDARREEILIMMKGQYLKFGIAVLSALAAKLTFLILILSYIWMGYVTTTETIFYILTLYYDLKTAFGYTIPLNTSRAAEFRAALIRLNKLLNTEEVRYTEDEDHGKPIIELENVSVTIKDKEILRNINLKIDRPGLILVTGGVGSGKSSLLKTILREYTSEGEIHISGTISYASQEPWLFPSSVKENILFGQRYDRDRYQEVVRICALEYDFSLLQSGDETIVADRGLNLSKGQQARVNLARAIYKDSDIYLLDDSLTALDVTVQNFIFTECVTKFLNGKICILVTQNVSHLSKVEKIITLEDGRVALPQKLLKEQVQENVNSESEVKVVPSFDHTKNGVSDNQNESTVYHEVKKEGKVELTVYKKYFKYGGGLIAFCGIMSLYFISQFIESYSDELLTDWIDLQQKALDLSMDPNITKDILAHAVFEKDSTFNWYTGLTIILTVIMLVKFYALLRFCRNASINIHRVMSLNLINSVMTFFDTHFLGNVLNRFSYDLYNIDENLPFLFPDMIATLFVCAGSITLLIKVNWIFLVPSGIFIIGLYLMRRIYISSGRSLKRLEAATRSPLVGHINSSLEGLTTIRAFKAESLLRNQFDVYQDLYSSAFFTLNCTTTGFEFFMDILCGLFSTLVVVRFLFFDHDSSAGNVGLALTQVFMLTEYIQWGMRQWADIENHMTSLERVLEYTAIKNEDTVGKELENWPTGGSVNFEKVGLIYEGIERPVLKNISFAVKAGQKVGIVGRTGAGKSSIISTLFRLYEFQGRILLDGVDINTLSLSFLRKTIAIIPQDPILFSGTIRSNIDPKGLYTDEEVWKAIEKVNVKHLISSLDYLITEGNCNFSVGQKQLICLARVAIGKYKIVVLDEATANMDAATDEMLNGVIKEIFADCTILIIAHRLASILDCDLVVVMDKGQLIESDTPNNLLRDSSSVFCNMCKQTTEKK